MNSGEKLMKYMTERAVIYIETPKEIRKHKRKSKRQSWTYYWFGMLPLSIHMWFKNRKNKFKIK